MQPKGKGALKVTLLILFVFRPGLGSLITWFDLDHEGTKHGSIYSGFRFDTRGAFDSDYWQHFPPAKLLCFIDMPASLFSDTIALPATVVVELRRPRRADAQRKQQDGVANLSQPLRSETNSASPAAGSRR